MEDKMILLQQKLEADEQLVEKLVQQESPEDVQALLKENGVEMTLEEINVMTEALMKSMEGSAEEELSEEDLEEVAGGVVITLAGVAAVAGIIGGTASAGNFVHNVSRGRW